MIELLDPPDTGTDELGMPHFATGLRRAQDKLAYLRHVLLVLPELITELLADHNLRAVISLRHRIGNLCDEVAAANLGKDAVLVATEALRRSQRAAGLAIRQGQARGVISRRSTEGTRNRHGIRPGTLLGQDELSHSAYPFADGVSDAAWEAALDEARRQRNMSNANLRRILATGLTDGANDWIPATNDRSPSAAIRRRDLIRELAAQNWSSRQIGEKLAIDPDTIRRIGKKIGVTFPADTVIARTRKHDSARIVSETVNALEGLALGVELAHPGDIDADQARQWAEDITKATRTINTLVRRLREEHAS